MKIFSYTWLLAGENLKIGATDDIPKNEWQIFENLECRMRQSYDEISFLFIDDLFIIALYLYNIIISNRESCLRIRLEFLFAQFFLPSCFCWNRGGSFVDNEMTKT